MKILIVSHKYPPSIGGMQKHCFELVSGLSQSNTVLTLVSGKTSKLFFFLTIRRKVKQLLKNHPDIDIIYLNDGLMAFILGSFITQLNKPVFMTAHGLDIVFPIPFYQKWVSNSLKKLTGIIAVSEGTRMECEKRGIPSDKLFLVPNAISPIENNNLAEMNFEFNPEKKYLVSLGRAVKRKGFSWFIKNVLSSLPGDYEYIIIGPSLKNHWLWNTLKLLLPRNLFQSIVIFGGVAIDHLEIAQTIKRPKLQNRIHLLHGLNDAQVNTVLNKAATFIMPNIQVNGDYEGFGLVLLEASLRGVPVVASKTDGIPTAIHDGKNGYLLTPQSSDEWLSKIKEIDLRAAGKSFQHYTSSHFTIQKMVSGYESIFANYS